MKMIANVCVEREKFINEDYVTDNHLLFVVEEGEFYVSNGNDEASLTKGNALIIIPGIRYHREVITPVKIHIFRFKTNKDLKTIPLKMKFEDEGRIESSLKLLNRLNSDIFPDDLTLRQTIMNDIINQYIIENSFCYNSNSKHDTLMQNAVLLIENNIKDNLSLYDISTKLGMSYVQFARRFKQYTGMSPIVYMNEARMKLARELLSNSDFLIKQIASECGYENEYYFSNAFKKHNGVSPLEYRKAFI